MTLRTNLVHLAWDPVAGSTNYEIQLDGVKVALAGPRAKTTKITIPEGAERKVTIKALPSGEVQEARFEWASLVTPPPPPSGQILWNGDYETGNLSQYLYEQAKAPGRISVQTAVKRQGNYAARFEVRPGDNNVSGSGSGERAEVMIGQADTGAYEGQEWFYGWSTLLDSGYQAVPNQQWNYIWQIHNTGSSGQANICVNANADGHMYLRVCNGSNPESPTCTYYRIVTNYQRSRWYDFVLRIKWSSDPAKGLIEAWVDGVNVLPIFAIATLYPGQGGYLKQGLYRAGGSTTTAIVYHDNTRRSSP